MTHITNTDLQTLVSTIKTVRIILDKERQVTILGIPDNGNSVTVDSNRKTIDEDPDWNFDTACNLFEIWPQALDHCRIIHGGDFPNLLHRALVYFLWHTLVQKGAALVKASSLQPVEDDDEADESYNPSDDKEDEAGA
ncbi:hypothetical protein M9H77_06848 [Catharanthus roseus]|uniref:Uncharacterized protein n=1 Tax=Catharanthus roseus TaxID=4058 RepID=A0ACC0BTN5_CATRO|nr:hypothetical protein M9H77_06848 [Catharanthus roseus]